MSLLIVSLALHRRLYVVFVYNVCLSGLHNGNVDFESVRHFMYDMVIGISMNFITFSLNSKW